MEETIKRFKNDIEKLKRFIKDEYSVELNDETIVDLWETYSDEYYAAGWISLPEDINLLKNDENFNEILKSKFPKACLILFEDISGVAILKRIGEISILDINNKEIENLLDIVPEIEKNYYENVLKRKLFKNNFFIKFRKNEKNYILYIINSENIENIKDLKTFLQV